MPPTVAAMRSRSAKTRTGWPRTTAPSRTTAGRKRRGGPWGPTGTKEEEARRAVGPTGTEIENESSTDAAPPQDRGLPQLRHHGPHRCRQDHYDRADPLLYRQVL